MVERIASILPAKGSVLHFVSPDAPVYDAVVTMAARGIGAVLVIEQGSLVGIISAKDYAYTLTPQKVYKTALFMNRIGTVKTRPNAWTDLFFPEVQGLQGD